MRLLQQRSFSKGSSIKRVTKPATLLLLSALLLTGCGSADDETLAEGQPSFLDEPAKVSVERGDIVPTFSGTAAVEQANAFVISLPERGSFKAAVKADTTVKAGAVIGWTNGNPITAPVNAKVTKVMSPSLDLPAYYPVIELEYLGFALKVNAGAFLGSLGGADINGKFQIRDGVGPADCVAVVANAGENHPDQSEEENTAGAEADAQALVSETSEEESGENKKAESAEKNAVNPAFPRISSGYRSCLISLDAPVRPGQQGTLVLNAAQRTNVIVVPVSSVAGREGSGKVTKYNGNKPQEVEVKLGISDGARIEIISGLDEGDEIATVAPNLDPRKN